MRTVHDIGEFRLIERLSRLMPNAPFVVEGIGDDCGVVRMGERLLLASSDMFIEDVHFRRDHILPSNIGWKAAASCISDVAAMGGTPTFCLVSIACPPSTDLQFVEQVYKGILSVLSRFGVVILGGDTTSSPQGLVIDMTVIGQTMGPHFLRRRGARNGDLLAITGWPGMSAAGFHALEHDHDAPTLVAAHQQPRPRVREGQWLCARPSIHALIDVSDGLLQDAGHIAKASNLGVNIDSNGLPIHSDLDRYCQMHGLDAHSFVLTGGEDYELAFAMSPDQHERSLQDFHHEFRTELTIIGEFTNEWSGVRVGGEETDWTGFQHFAE